MTSWRWALVLSLVLAAASIVFVILFGSPPGPGSAPMSAGFRSPVMALELAKSVDDLAFLQGDAAAELRAHLVRVQQLDWGFPLAYAGMAAAFFAGLGLRGGKLNGLAWAALAVALFAIPADYMENRVINRVLADLAIGADPSERLDALQAHTWMKWGAIGLYGALMAALMWVRGHRLLALPGVLVAASVVWAALSGAAGGPAEIMALAMIPFMLGFPVAAIMLLRQPDSG